MGPLQHTNNRSIFPVMLCRMLQNEHLSVVGAKNSCDLTKVYFHWVPLTGALLKGSASHSLLVPSSQAHKPSHLHHMSSVCLENTSAPPFNHVFGNSVAAGSSTLVSWNMDLSGKQNGRKAVTVWYCGVTGFKPGPFFSHE